MNLKKNMCPLDRALRSIVGVAMIVVALPFVGFVEGTVTAIVLAGFGVLNIASSLAAICPVYALAGLSSISEPEEEENALSSSH